MSIQVLFTVRQQHYQTFANSQVVTCLEISKITPRLARWCAGPQAIRGQIVSLREPHLSSYSS
jgi:hypothetical protein